MYEIPIVQSEAMPRLVGSIQRLALEDVFAQQRDIAARKVTGGRVLALPHKQLCLTASKCIRVCLCPISGCHEATTQQ